MSIALVQSVGPSADPFPSATITMSTSPTTAGNLLIFSLLWSPSSASVTSLQDNAGNMYSHVPGTQTIDSSGNTFQSDIWYCADCNGGATTVTLIMSGGITPSGAYAYVSEWSGIATISPVDTASAQNATTGIPSSLSLTPSTTNGLLYTHVVPFAINPTGVNSPWETFVGDTNQVIAYLINPGLSGPLAPTYVTSSQTYLASAAAFLSATPPALVLNLSDSVVIGDSFNAGGTLPLAVSDSTNVSNSFLMQSDQIVVVPTPVVETLINKLIPSFVKTYFRIEE